MLQPLPKAIWASRRFFSRHRRCFSPSRRCSGRAEGVSAETKGGSAHRSQMPRPGLRPIILAKPKLISYLLAMVNHGRNRKLIRTESSSSEPKFVHLNRNWFTRAEWFSRTKSHPSRMFSAKAEGVSTQAKGGSAHHLQVPRPRLLEIEPKTWN